MKKLNQEEIGFINTYLGNSNVIYLDIRMEMVDHIATAIEKQMNEGDTRDFYDMFKDYMVEHKASLLKNNKKFLRSTDKRILKMMFKNLCSLQGVLCLILASAFFYLLFENVSYKTLKLCVYSIPLLSFLVLALSYTVFLGLKKQRLNRFSGVERIGSVSVSFSHAIYLLGIIRRVDTSDIKKLSFMMFFFITSIVLLFLISKTTIQMINYHKQHYKLV